MGTEPGSEEEEGGGRRWLWWWGRKKKNSTCESTRGWAEQSEGALKLLDKDMFNWAVDNSVFSRFTGRHSAALKSVAEGRRKGWVGVTCEEHKRARPHVYRQHTHTHTHPHTHTTRRGPLGVGKHGGEGSTSLIAPLIKKPVARRSTPIVS